MPDRPAHNDGPTAQCPGCRPYDDASQPTARPEPDTYEWHADAAILAIHNEHIDLAISHLLLAGALVDAELNRTLVARAANTAQAHTDVSLRRAYPVSGTGLFRDGLVCQSCGVPCAHLAWRGETRWWHLNSNGEPTTAPDQHAAVVEV